MTNRLKEDKNLGFWLCQFVSMDESFYLLESQFLYLKK